MHLETDKDYNSVDDGDVNNNSINNGQNDIVIKPYTDQHGTQRVHDVGLQIQYWRWLTYNEERLLLSNYLYL